MKLKDELVKETGFDYFTHIDFLGREWVVNGIAKTWSGYKIKYHSEKANNFVFVSFMFYDRKKVNAELEQQISNIETAKNDPDVQAFIRQKEKERMEEERNKTYDTKTERIKNKFGKLI